MKKAEELATSFISGLMEKMGIEGQVTVLPQTECDQLRLDCPVRTCVRSSAAAAIRSTRSSISARSC